MKSPAKPNSTIAYYDEFGRDFSASTMDLNMGIHHDRFLTRIPPGGAILDLGCGSGRDSLAFLNSGYSVVLVDGSHTMVDAATALTGEPARLLTFDQLDYVEAFDGVWACASLLHVRRSDLSGVFEKVLLATRPGGVIYVSFKSGEGERASGGRLFTDFTVPLLRDWVGEQRSSSILEVWETSDVRPGRTDERWVNAIIEKGFP